MPTWIEQMCRRECIRRLSAWGILLVIVLLGLSSNPRYTKNFFRGPFPLSNEQLARITDANSLQQYFVRISGTEIFDTGVKEFSVETENGKEKSRKIAAGFYALRAGERFLLVKSSKPVSSTVAGELVPIQGELRAHLTATLGPKVFSERLYPVALESEGFREGGYWAIGLFVVFLAILIYFARPPWMKLQDLSRHPALRRAMTWGSLQTLSAEVQMELESRTQNKASGVRLTEKFVVVRRFFAFDLFRFHDLLWAYKKVTKHSINLIPTGKTYQAMLFFPGGSVAISARQSKVDEILQYSASRAAWAYFGYSAHVQDRLTLVPDDFAKEVAERRSQFVKGQ